MAYDSTKPVTGGSLVAADIRENQRALKEDGIVLAGDLVSTLKDPAASTAGLRTLGTGAQQAMPGNTVITPPDNSITAAKLAANKAVYLSDPSSATPLQISSDSRKYTASTSYAKVKEIKIPKGGTLRIAFTLEKNQNADAYGVICRNGNIVGTQRTIGTSSNPIEFFEDISGWTENDLCQIYCRTTNSTFQASVFNFRIYASEYQITL